MKPANNYALPAGTGQGVGNASDVSNIGGDGTTPWPVVNGQGMRAYEKAKTSLAQQHPDLTPAEYAAACREAARLAGV